MNTKRGPKGSRIKFNQQIRGFLEMLDFADVDGARPSFSINDTEIDVCGGHEHHLLIIRCLTHRREISKSLRNKINEFRGIADDLKVGCKKHPLYKKYKYYHFILATKNINVAKSDIDFANKAKPRIYIWDDNFLEYYSDLSRNIHIHAKYDLLGEIDIFPSGRESIEVPAFQFKVENNKIYCFVIDPRRLLEVSYVARREKRNERYYQRIVNKKKIQNIQKFIDEGNILPNNLIISIGKGVEFKAEADKTGYKGMSWPYLGLAYGILKFPKNYRSCWIIDGQHRLYGFVRSKKWFNMPVTAFEDLDIERQCKIFLDINKTQTPVKPELLWDLNGDMIPNEEDGVISRIAKDLNDHKPLFHKVYIPSLGIRKKGTRLKLSAICEALREIKIASYTTRSKTKNPFYSDNKQELVKNASYQICQYLKCVERKLSEDWKAERQGFILTDKGMSVMLSLFQRILSRCVSGGNERPQEADYFKYIDPLVSVFRGYHESPSELKKLKSEVASKSGASEVLKRFTQIIAKATRDRLFAGTQEFGIDEYVAMERDVKQLIKEQLCDPNDDNWIQSIVNDTVFGTLQKRQEKKGVKDAKNLYLELNLGECFEIFRLNYDKLKQFFIGRSRFPHKESFFSALKSVNKCRIDEAHHTVDTVNRSPIVEGYHKTLSSCIRDALHTL